MRLSTDASQHIISTSFSPSHDLIHRRPAQRLLGIPRHPLSSAAISNIISMESKLDGLNKNLHSQWARQQLPSKKKKEVKKKISCTDLFAAVRTSLPFHIRPPPGAALMANDQWHSVIKLTIALWQLPLRGDCGWSTMSVLRLFRYHVYVGWGWLDLAFGGEWFYRIASFWV